MLPVAKYNLSTAAASSAVTSATSSARFARSSRPATLLRQDSWPTLPAFTGPAGLQLVAPARKRHAPQLKAGRWAPHNRAYINDFLLRMDKQPRHGAPWAAVFDWDETSMVGDTVNMLLQSTFEHLEITLPPDAFAATLETRIGTREHLQNGVHIPSLCADIVDAYKVLYPLVRAGALEAAQALPAYQDFRTKMLIYYQQFYYDPDYQGRDDYNWLQWFKGVSETQLHERVVRAFKTYSQHSNPTATWSTATRGRTGALTYTFKTQPARNDDMVDLMRCLKKVGVEPFVVTASIQTLVQGLAKHLGYPVKRNSIFGSRALFDAAGRIVGSVESPKSYPVAFKAGKSQIIEQYIQRTPVLVAGDSDGDSHMLAHFAGTQVRLIVDLQRSRGKIFDLAQLAKVPPHAQPGHVRTLLQAFN